MGRAEPHGGGFVAVAGCAVLGGAVTMLVALVAAPGSWLTGYVSEAGTAGQSFAVPYRVGLLVLAAGVALLGRGLAPASRRTGVLLAASAVLAGTSAVVPCSDRCPLPPYEPTTVDDVVHTAASIAGMAGLAGAMLSLVLAQLRRSLRRLTMVALGCTVPLGATLGLSMLLIGRSQVSAILERVLLVVAVSWLIGTAGLASLRHTAIPERRTSPEAGVPRITASGTGASGTGSPGPRSGSPG